MSKLFQFVEKEEDKPVVIFRQTEPGNAIQVQKMYDVDDNVIYRVDGEFYSDFPAAMASAQEKFRKLLDGEQIYGDNS